MVVFGDVVDVVLVVEVFEFVLGWWFVWIGVLVVDVVVLMFVCVKDDWWLLCDWDVLVVDVLLFVVFFLLFEVVFMLIVCCLVIVVVVVSVDVVMFVCGCYFVFVGDCVVCYDVVDYMLYVGG